MTAFVASIFAAWMSNPASAFVWLATAVWLFYRALDIRQSWINKRLDEKLKRLEIEDHERVQEGTRPDIQA